MIASGAVVPPQFAARLPSLRLPTAHGPALPRACPAVYLVQGLLGLSRLAVFTFLKDDLGLTPATVALITSAGYAPWVSLVDSVCQKD